MLKLLRSLVSPAGRLPVVVGMSLLALGLGAGTPTAPVRNRTVPLIVWRHGYAKAALARVTIDGRHYLFLIDTGAAKTALRTSVALALGLRPQGPDTRVMTAGCSTEAGHLLLSDWQLHGVALPPTVVMTAGLAGVPPRVAGQQVAGLLGSDVLAQFRAIRLEYSRSRLVLGATPSAAGRSVPIIVHHLPALGGQVELVHATLGRAPATLLVDTGASLTTIDSRLARRGQTVAFGPQGSVRGAAGCQVRVRAVAIADWKLQGLVMPSAYALSGSIAAHGHGISFQGLLGSDVLSFYRQVTLEFAPRPRLILDGPMYHAHN